MKLTDKSKLAMSEIGIPDYMHGAIIRYYENRIPPGGFLTALINNDLKETYARADDTNIHCIQNYMLWFYNHAPVGSWGHSDAVHNWLAHTDE